ncbi:type II secretion system protein GspE [Erwinia sp. OLTSP20]|uniref:type II secretion system protein GspE n=1 Tax=unclassified Erwinia TaxID=2622719 RepID=UPI000C18461D|nr:MULTISPECIES: type II secretion system protein GspE [unclassified Erwinia]PIJ49765.1 type II secretion system protein GspE [Erwinia sp. OAMSP11]PIJ70864.1 type II secretion system protein GspE [Erwinia sp. OLSSP12]PIJ80229.1 type II secretion system protein GspE [Erwinia sp. OLCASP19]PIJ82353.1 type II secretion system protein GspE [Erwinia sp. OLMTSP26]PIJ85039.1 type II secretion system protein GspE [Erwinia sp. OLMDSP33]
MSMADATMLHALCQRYQAVLLENHPDCVTIATAGQAQDDLMEALRFVCHARIEVLSWSPGQIAAWRDKNDRIDPTPFDQENLATAARLERLLQLALQHRASDIHLEPQADGFRVRLRIDGVLQIASTLSLASGHALVARLKVLAALDIAERRFPQDGQFSQQHDTGQNLSFRLSTLPTQYGEKAVLRLQQHAEQTDSLNRLGMSAPLLLHFQQALNQPQGMILVTGPTGSGKTLTLYSALSWLNQPQRNICSVEDPIEIPLPGIIQTQVNHKIDLGFRQVLRALLRQDPDIIMLGEIRDAETAAIAVNAAQTGHLVLSTLHTNSTLETLVRLRQMGLPGYQLGPALKMVIAQRLVRRLCPYCRQTGERLDNLPATLWSGTLQNWLATGCDRCFSGFYGRLALFEVLPISQPLQAAIASDASQQQLQSLVAEQNLSRLFSEGLQAVNRGDTTLEELKRVTGSYYE